MTDAAPRLAVVTGGTAGIGLATVTALARDGWHVLACSRNPGAAAGMPEGVQPVACDVADPDSVRALAEVVSRQEIPLGAVVNSAGMALPRAPFLESSEEQMRQMFEINAFGTMRVLRALLPMMTSGGTVVNLSSTLAARPRPGSALYAATKGAVERFSTALATEVAGKGIRVHVVAPALVRSEIWLRAGMSTEDYDDLLAARGREFPLGRAGEPEDVADLICYLVSDKAVWLTGNLIPVDGGAMLR
ncbi:MAG: SDR family oxidoreductase [Roseovarius sp.]|nr:SDR family oxidoreductase [Roseovarius sp.]